MDNKYDHFSPEAQAVIAVLQSRANLLETRLKSVASQKDLLKAVLKITCMDCSLKNEQFGMLFTNLALNPVWQDIEKEDTDTPQLSSPTPLPPPVPPSSSAASSAFLSTSTGTSNESKPVSAHSSYKDTIDNDDHDDNIDACPQLPISISPRAQMQGAATPSEKTERNFFRSVPYEVHFEYLQFLDFRDLCALQCVCLEFALILRDEKLWRYLLIRYYNQQGHTTVNQYGYACRRKQKQKYTFSVQQHHQQQQEQQQQQQEQQQQQQEQQQHQRHRHSHSRGQNHNQRVHDDTHTGVSLSMDSSTSGGSRDRNNSSSPACTSTVLPISSPSLTSLALSTPATVSSSSSLSDSVCDEIKLAIQFASKDPRRFSSFVITDSSALSTNTEPYPSPSLTTYPRPSSSVSPASSSSSSSTSSLSASSSSYSRESMSTVSSRPTPTSSPADFLSFFSTIKSDKNQELTKSTKTQWSWHGYHRDERPWKVKFQERVTTDRNWLHGKPCISTLAGHTGTVTCLKFDHKRLISGSDDGSLVLWNFVSPKDHERHRYRSPYTYLSGGTDISTDDNNSRTTNHTNTKMDISSLCSSSLSLPSVTAAEQKALEAKKQNASTAKTHKSILNMKQSKHKHGTLYQQHHKNTKLTYKMSSFVGHGGPVWCCDFEGDRLVSGSYDKTIKIWNMKTGNIDCTLRGHTSWVSSIQLSRDTIVSGSWDASLKVWKLKEDVDRNKEGGHVDGHNSDYTYDSYGSNSNHHHHKDRRRYITQGKPSPPSPPSSVYHSSQRKKLTGECVATLDGENGNVVYCHQWDVRTGIINAGCRQQVVKTWDINTQTVVRTYMGHVKQVYCLQFDDAKIVSGSEAIKVWDCKSGLCEMTLNEHSNPIMCVMFDDHKLVSGSYDKTIKIWDMRTSRVMRTLEGHSAAVFCLQMDHDKVITGSADKLCKVWDFNQLKFE